MAEPLIERIAEAIKTCLEGVTVANGYTYDVAEVIRPKRLGGYGPRHLLVVLQQEDPDEADEPQTFKTWTQPFAIDVFVRPSDASTEAVDSIINRIRSDIEKALTVDVTFGGLCVDGHVRPPIGFQTEDGSFEGVRVRWEAVYRHPEDDPYSQA